MRALIIAILTLAAAPTAMAAGDKYCAAQIRAVEHQVIKNGQQAAVKKQAEEHDAEHFRRMLERCGDNASQQVRSVWAASLAQLEGRPRKP